MEKLHSYVEDIKRFDNLITTVNISILCFIIIISVVVVDDDTVISCCCVYDVY
jgi:hypothetical protein